MDFPKEGGWWLNTERFKITPKGHMTYPPLNLYQTLREYQKGKKQEKRMEMLGGLIVWEESYLRASLTTSNLAVLLFFPALFISGIHKVSGIKYKDG